MLDIGTRVKIVLEDGEEPVTAKVVHCSATGRSCKIELDNGEIKAVNLLKHEYTVLEEEEEPAMEEAKADEEDASSSDAEEEEPVENGAAEAQNGAGDSASDGASEDDGGTEEDGSDSDGNEANGNDSDGLDSDGLASDAFDSDSEADTEELVPELDCLTEAQAAPLEAFEGAAEPTAFLQASEALAALARAAARSLYGVQAKTMPQALPELYVDGFDPEQIWLQLDMLGAPALKHVRRLLRKLHDKEDSLTLLTAQNEEALDELLGLASEEEGSEVEEDEEGSDGSDDSDAEAAGSLRDLDYDAMLNGGDDAQQAKQAKQAPKKKSAPRALAAVEDGYLKLDEMEAFLEDAERAAAEEEVDEDEEDEEPRARAKAGKKGAQARGGLAEGLVLATDDLYDAGRPGDLEQAAEAMYQDFFGPRRGGRPAARYEDADFEGEAAPEEAEGEGASSGEEDDALDERMEPAEEEEEEEEEDGDDDLDEDDKAAGSSDDNDEEEALDAVDESDEEDAAAGYVRGAAAEAPTRLSTHEQQQLKLAERIRTLEQEALAARDWFLRGEIDARKRPKNSALEIDMDFETTVAPPPAPSEEATSTLEERIKGRIRELRFDDVVRVAPPPPPRAERPEIDDRKSGKGLAELYAEDYQRQVMGVVEDRDEPVRAQARRLFAALAGKLDALSHAHFRPAPVAAEAGAPDADAPAILMEEVAPQLVSEASRRAPEEVHAAGKKETAPAESELEREERRRRRAQRKRASKKRTAQREAERVARAVSAGGAAPVLGRKSEQATLLGGKKGKRKATGAPPAAAQPKRGHFTKSAAVFGNLQAMQERGGHKAAKPAADGPSAKQLRL
ncbi:hypothetical protein QBZ16_003574 [Prototheca wickerhamii]|uniref:Uncharacterized protein n=1 Tax=Prototheca wickerhamii TaxID=3111 RepID=A0AAD9MHL0_PROWI|nr:hypothetical protein QBZ16_003574 [Prototheca wickerhamii]